MLIPHHILQVADFLVSNSTYSFLVFSFLPPHKQLLREKLPNSGYCYEQIVKNGMDFSGDGGDPEIVALAIQIPHLSSSCGKGTAKTLSHSLKKSPSKSSKKDVFWMMRPWHVQPWTKVF